jgi:hypothetical protein
MVILEESTASTPWYMLTDKSTLASIYPQNGALGKGKK